MTKSPYPYIMLLVTVLLCAEVSTVSGQQSDSRAGRSASVSNANTDEARIADLVLANHILFSQQVLDGYGHVSVRSVKEPTHFYMSRDRAAGMVRVEDIMEFDQDSKPIVQNGPRVYGERFIHGEIYRIRPDIQAIVHSHSPAVIPFGATDVSLRPLIHMAGFLPQKVPVFEIRDVMDEQHGMLVRSNRLGAALAKSLGKGPVVLMRGHGDTVVGQSVRQAVFYAIYTELNARTELDALRLSKTVTFLNAAELAFYPKEIGFWDRPWEIWKKQAGD